MTLSPSPSDLPPGQIATGRLVVIGERSPGRDAPNDDTWSVTLDGCVASPRAFTLADLRALPQEDVHRDIHCVTGWTRPDTCFGGVPLRTLLDLVRPAPDARFARFVAWSDRDHDTSLPLEVARTETWVGLTLDGAPLPRTQGGPVRTVTPSRYFYKSLKWLRRIELLPEDRLGYWERDLGYHNRGDPWAEERYVTGGLPADRIVHLQAGRRLAPFRRKLVLGVALPGWDPADRDLRGMMLKDCDLRDARLANVDARGANLTRCDLSGADLQGADLREADLEGACLEGADLRDADLRGARLTAVRLGDGEARARVSGARVGKDAGLLEAAEHLLRAGGAILDPTNGDGELVSGQSSSDS